MPLNSLSYNKCTSCYQNKIFWQRIFSRCAQRLFYVEISFPLQSEFFCLSSKHFFIKRTWNSSFAEIVNCFFRKQWKNFINVFIIHRSKNDVKFFMRNSFHLPENFFNACFVVSNVGNNKRFL